jgi:ribosomal protein S12 methylthiotransferase accessory factor
MEAIELAHAENPPASRVRRTTLEALTNTGVHVVRPEELHGFRDVYFGDRFVCDWIDGENLVDGSPTWIPASAVYFYCTPGLHDTSTNGLASGNHLAEATLHALYELIERDAMTRLSVRGVLRIRDNARVIDPATVDDDTLRDLIDRIERQNTKLVLLALQSAVAVHTLWAVLLNRSPLAPVSTLNIGWGTHVDPRIAACRAITEAAQSRLTFIHGAREDLLTKPVYRAHNVGESAAVRYFEHLRPTATWSDVKADESIGFHDDLEVLLHRLVNALATAGHRALVRVSLTDPIMDIPVVKVLAPTLKFSPRMF